MIPWCFSYYCLRCLGFSPCCSPFRCGILLGKSETRNKLSRFGGAPFSFGFSEPNKHTGKNREVFEDDWKDRRFFEMVLWNGEKFEGPPTTNMDTQNCFIWNPCCFYSFLRRLLIVFHTPVGFLLPTVALLLRVCFWLTKSF